MNNGFLTIPNLEECLNVFKDYMNKNYTINMDYVVDDQQLKEFFYNEMLTISNNHTFDSSSLKDKNNHVMNIVKSRVLKLKKQGPELMTSVKDTNFTKDFDNLLKARNDENSPAVHKLPSELESAIVNNDLNEFEMNQKLKEYQNTRDINNRLLSSIEINKMNGSIPDPNELYKALAIPPPVPQDEHSTNKEIKYIIPAPKYIKNDIYISINGADRDWHSDRLRYKYVVDFSSKKDNSISNTPRNIEMFKVSCVMIPAEICERKHDRCNPKLQFQHDFDFQYPYIMLRIDEFPSNYDGTNSNVRNCFCKLLFDKTYKTPNGRGYTLLKPMQDEKIVFFPNTLSTLQQLSLSFLKPNGTLFNNSIDDYLIFKIEHESFNPLYLKIVVDKFFDKNEFFPGDHVNIRNFVINKNKDVPTIRLLEFVNRYEGHDVVEIGKPNDDGYYNSFYVVAPGIINQKMGTLKEDAEIIDALNIYNSGINWLLVTDTCGEIINTSLQNVISMKMTVNIPDSTQSINSYAQ